MNGKRYFPNHWKEFKDADPELFVPHTFDEVMEWKVMGWELRSDVFCIIRTTNLKTKRVKEYVYRNPIWADRRVAKLMKTKTHDFCVTTHEAQHYVGPQRQDDDDAEF
tara:strand:- start:277 stop:600 length:324 start_codon:yes stop_codon:yes gene_type:complete